MESLVKPEAMAANAITVEQAKEVLARERKRKHVQPAVRRMQRAIRNLFQRNALTNQEIVKTVADYLAENCPEIKTPERKPKQSKTTETPKKAEAKKK